MTTQVASTHVLKSPPSSRGHDKTVPTLQVRAPQGFCGVGTVLSRPPQMSKDFRRGVLVARLCRGSGPISRRRRSSTPHTCFLCKATNRRGPACGMGRGLGERIPRLPDWTKTSYVDGLHRDLRFPVSHRYACDLDSLMVTSAGNANLASTSTALMMPTGTGQAA
jgi:hypothetical protein